MDNGWISTRVRDFGGYTVMLDTVAPVITPKNIGEGYDMTHKSYIEFEIADNLTGTTSYNGFVDNQWVLFEYDPKSDKVRYYFDENYLEKRVNREHCFSKSLTNVAICGNTPAVLSGNTCTFFNTPGYTNRKFVTMLA